MSEKIRVRGEVISSGHDEHGYLKEATVEIPVSWENVEKIFDTFYDGLMVDNTLKTQTLNALKSLLQPEKENGIKDILVSASDLLDVWNHKIQPHELMPEKECTCNEYGIYCPIHHGKKEAGSIIPVEGDPRQFKAPKPLPKRIGKIDWSRGGNFPETDNPEGRRLAIDIQLKDKINELVERINELEAHNKGQSHE